MLQTSAITSPLPQTLTGRGWTAEIFPGRAIAVTVTPFGDFLPGAIDALLTPERQRYFTVRYLSEDEGSRDCYLLEPM